jgi:hypothetical protein
MQPPFRGRRTSRQRAVGWRLCGRNISVREAQKRAQAFRRHGAALDKATREFVAKFDDLRAEASALRAIGCDHLSIPMIDANCRREHIRCVHHSGQSLGRLRSSHNG